MEGADDVEEVFLKIVRSRLVVGPEGMVIEHAFLTRARRTDVPAGVAADAARELPAPEGEALLGRHGLELPDRLKARRAAVLTLLAQQLVKADELSGLADRAALQKGVFFCHGLFAVERLDAQRVAIFLHGGHALAAECSQLFHVTDAVALHAHGIDRLTRDAVLLLKLDEGIAVAGLEKRRDSAALLRFRDEVF